MNGKKFVITTLFAVVLLTLAFIPISSQQDVREYDAWADMNDDGKIDIYDIAYSAIKFGTTGDPTRNVNVTNWPQWLALGNVSSMRTTRTVTIAWNKTVFVNTSNPEGEFIGSVNTDGYREVSIFLRSVPGEPPPLVWALRLDLGVNNMTMKGTYGTYTALYEGGFYFQVRWPLLEVYIAPEGYSGYLTISAVAYLMA